MCRHCLESGHLLWIENNKCSKCNRPKKITKLDPKIIERIYCDGINDIRYLIAHYTLLLKFWSIITDLLKNDPNITERYLSNFKEYENQLINSKSKYLKNYYLQMLHYDPTKSSKKTSHNLSSLDILNTSIIDNKYLLGLSFLNLRGPGPFINQMAHILSGYGFPDDIVLTKISSDILQLTLRSNNQK